jgi:hypothetical protein
MGKSFQLVCGRPFGSFGEENHEKREFRAGENKECPMMTRCLAKFKVGFPFCK